MSPHSEYVAKIVFEGNRADLVTIVAGVAVFYLVRKHNFTRASRPISQCAALAATAAVLNPAIVSPILESFPFNVLMRLLSIPWLIGAPGELGIQSVRTGVIALVLGIIAWMNVRKSDGKLWGKPLAQIAALGGLFWIIS